MSKPYQRKNRARTFNKVLETLEHRRLLAGTIVITKGGTYSGEWESLDRNVPAVQVKTAEPVIIEDSIVRGTGDLIVSGAEHTNITIRNVQGYGLNPNVYGKTAGDFISVEKFDNLVVEGSYFEHLKGINLLNYAGDRTPAETVRIVNNSALNIDGRKSDGSGGYLNFNERTNKATGVEEDGYDYAQFVQFDKVQGVPGIEIAWNQVINEPGNSRVEDNISMYKSSGTSASPILIHDNYIQGAYTIKPWQDDYSDATYDYDWGFSGGGIMLGDGVGTSPATDPSYVEAYQNTVISTTNYGIALSAGHHLTAYNNRTISAGKLADGRTIANQNVGFYVWDSYGAGSSHFYSNIARDNVSGWVQGGGRNDWWSPVSSNVVNNVHLSGTITLATEAAELARWQAAFDAHIGTTPPAPQPTIPELPTEPTEPTPPPRTDEPPKVDPIEPTPEPVQPTPVDEEPSNPQPHEPEPTTPTKPVDPIDFPTPVEEPVTTPPVNEPVPPITFPPVEQPTTPGEEEPELVTIEGIIFADRDNNGVFGARDKAVQGRTVYVDSNLNRKLDKGELRTKTDASGHWELKVEPGTYEVRQLVPTGWRATTQRGITVHAGVDDPIEPIEFGTIPLRKKPK